MAAGHRLSGGQAFRIALAIAIVWGLGCFGVGIATIYSSTYGHQVVEVMGSVYPGYEAAPWSGAVRGLLWGLVDGFIGTLIIVGIYNALAGGKCGASQAA